MSCVILSWFCVTDFWDTAGQERFRSITQSYYRSANALILTYDITCEESFRCLPEWLREIEQYASNKVITVLVGKPAPPRGLPLQPVLEPFLLQMGCSRWCSACHPLKGGPGWGLRLLVQRGMLPTIGTDV